MKKIIYLIVILFCYLGCKGARAPQQSSIAKDTLEVINTIFNKGGLGKELLGKPDTVYVIKSKWNKSWPDRYNQWVFKYVEKKPEMYLSDSQAEGYQKRFRLEINIVKIKNDTAKVVVAFVNAGSVDTFNLTKTGESGRLLITILPSVNLC